MNRPVALLALAICLMLCTSYANAAVINFDDIGLSGGALEVPAGYAGLTWGTSTEDSVLGNIGSWYAWDLTSYSAPHSTNNFVYNSYAPNNLWFSFAGPVATFNGAWFTRAFGSVSQADQVRVKDDLGNVSAWLDLTDTPQFLAAGFAGSTTIWVERQGSTVVYPEFGPARWYTMDDVTYEKGDGRGSTPELSTWMLLACSGLAGLGLWRRRKA
jgi:hypothetical protein